ncbi:MAG: putative rhamnosyl transferase [Acidipropionibacterium sp.]|nr:putative rhamnosyl transferase [Acidipropionibacterium sp.]
MRSQIGGGVRWLVYLDPQSPAWLLDRLAPLVGEGLLETRFREEVSWADLAADAREVTGAGGDLLITTNVDNDDALAVDFVSRVQAAAREGVRGAVYLTDGLVKAGDRSYAWRDRDNAFCNVIETWEDPQTAWRDWHILLGRHMPVTAISGAPGWLQVIHERNVSNRMRGRLTDPAGYRELFPGALDDIASPGRIELVRDAVISRPARQMREAVRAAGKGILLAALGKDGLERLKEKYHAVR